MESKIKHLEFVQTIIGRMAQNSFLLKGWLMTLALATISLTKVTQSVAYLYLVIFIFFLLDSYFLYQEKNFRDLYDRVRLGKIKTFEIRAQYNFKNGFKAIFSIPNLLFYLLVAVVVIFSKS